MDDINLFDLSGKVAIITGGGGLLATEHAIALYAYGAKIVVPLEQFILIIYNQSSFAIVCLQVLMEPFFGMQL